MQLHFYTRFDYIQRLEQGETIQVWTKKQAHSTDTHISLNLKDYVIEKTHDHVYNVTKII